MARKDGINKWDHNQFINLVKDNPKLTVLYHKGLPGIHSKIYHWYDPPLLDTPLSFTGSSNFSWHGFRDQNELMVETNFSNINEVFSMIDTISCLDPDTKDHIRLTTIKKPNSSGNNNDIPIDDGFQSEEIAEEQYEYVDLPLLLKNDSDIHQKSGLNWGQREGREPNQAYIPVPSIFNREYPDFFPPKEQEFIMLTDDKKQLICKMAQDNRKAIHTTQNNSIMGKYFRNRLAVPLGDMVKVEDVLDYKRTSVRIYKLNSETYFMDFGTHPPLLEIW